MRTQIIRRVIIIISCVVVGAVCLYGIGSVGYYCLFTHEAFEGKERFKALDTARSSAPYLSDFLRLFPSAQVNYRYFTRTDEPGFDVSVDLYEHYEFGMQLPALFDSSRRKVIGYGEPKFYILEVAAQEGRLTSYVLGRERHFGSAEWRQIVESGGNFETIGYSMITNQPVPGFKSRKHAE